MIAILVKNLKESYMTKIKNDNLALKIKVLIFPGIKSILCARIRAKYLCRAKYRALLSALLLANLAALLAAYLAAFLAANLAAALAANFPAIFVPSLTANPASIPFKSSLLQIFFDKEI